MEELKLLKKKKQLFSKDNKFQLAEVCNELAHLYFREGKFENASNEFKHEAKLYKELDKRILYAKASRMVGETYHSLGEFDKSLEYANIYLTIAKEENNALEKQRALATIGRIYLTKAITVSDSASNSLNLALGSFMQSLKLCEGLQNISKQEQMDIRARLLLNIGVVHEQRNEIDNAIEYMKNSMKICEAFDLCEQLCHAYSTLGSLYTKQEDYKNAITHLNLSIKAANRLTDKTPSLFLALNAKAEILIKLADFQSAKYVLLKAYKLKSPIAEEREITKHNLKVVAAMCQTEDILLTTPDTDYKKKKSLYEKMGDGACDLKIFDKAIDYYKKMLECAIASGESGIELSPAYISLAQTYKDAGQYHSALDYLQKDYEISRTNPEETCTTLLSIAEVLELAKRSYEDVAVVFNKARMQAQATGQMKLEGKVIKQFIDIQKKFKKYAEASALEKELVMMDYEESDNESEKDTSGTPDIGNDINIEDISDVSDGSDNDDPETNQPRSSRRRGKTFAIKKNSKGETQLHQACIQGNTALVRNLLDQGHIVNIRDNCGWLPIHEASNHGFLEIVRLLIDKGASINDRGGTLCDGITPLHDACSNGHLEIIELMLDSGASPLMQNNSGDTPLDLFKRWKSEESLDPIRQTFYETLVSKMTTALDKAGRPISNPNIRHKETLEESTASILPTPRRSPRNTPKKQSPWKQIGSLRHSVDVDDDLNPLPSVSGYNLSSHRDEISNSFESKRNNCTRNLSLLSTQDDSDNSNDSGNNTGREYKRVIESLRNRYPESKNKTSPRGKGKMSALVNTDNDGDDWLEDDLGMNQPGSKKRKRSSNMKHSFLNTTGMRKSNSFGSLKNSTTSPSRSEIEMAINSENDTDQENCTLPISNLEINAPNTGYDSSDSSGSAFTNKKRKSQSSLLESGFSKRRSDSPLNTFNFNTSSVTCVSKISNKSYKKQQKLSNFINSRDNFEPDSTTCVLDTSQFLNSTLNTSRRSVLAVNVRIESKLWRIPVPANDMDLLTIGWLAEEASKRYYNKEGISPTLQLETKEGAILDKEDPLSMVFNSPSQSDEVQSTIVSWNLPPLPERYVEACKSCNTDVNMKLKDHLDECQGTLHLKLANFSIKKCELTPLFRALNRQDNLQHIDLSGNMLQNEGFQQLCCTLPSLVQLRSLNLSLNNITGESIRYLSELFTSTSKPILENLIDLNLSFNIIGDDSIRHLATIFQNLKLRVLNLSACNLTQNIFDNISNHGFTLNLDHLKCLDLSYNALNKDSVIMFTSFLNFEIVTSLNFSHNTAIDECGIMKEIAENLQQAEMCSIKSLYLARCRVNDSEIWDLLRSLLKAHDLETLNLSYNDDLTSVTLRRLLQHRPSFSSIILEGCPNITQYLGQCASMMNPSNDLNTLSTLRSLKISMNYVKNSYEVDILLSIWERLWGGKAKSEKLFDNFIHLTVDE